MKSEWGGLEIVHVAAKDVVEPSSSWKSHPTQTVGKQVPTFPRGRMDQSPSARRRRKHHPDDVRDRAYRALRLAQLGELSATQQALEGAQLAPGDLTTLRALTDPDRKPPGDAIFLGYKSLFLDKMIFQDTKICS